MAGRCGARSRRTHGPGCSEMAPGAVRWIVIQSSQNANFGVAASVGQPVKRKPGVGTGFHEWEFRLLKFAFCELLDWKIRDLRRRTDQCLRRSTTAQTGQKKARLRQARRLLIVPFKTKFFGYTYYINEFNILDADDSPFCLAFGNQHLNSNKIR